MKKQYSNIFLIAGSGRNVGKTTFCCNIIEHFSKENRLIAIKITDHFHDIEHQELNYYHKSEDFIIAEETLKVGSKDTSRYLAAGADVSFLIVSKRDSLIIALDKLDSIIDLDVNPIIIESGAILDLLSPQISGFITDNQELNHNSGFDFVAHFINNKFDIRIEEFSLHGNNWGYH